jgi:hypothetical protein
VVLSVPTIHLDPLRRVAPATEQKTLLISGFWSTARPTPPPPEPEPTPEPESEPEPDPDLAGLASCGDPPLLPLTAKGMLIGGLRVCVLECAAELESAGLVLGWMRLGPGPGAILRTASRPMPRSSPPPLASDSERSVRCPMRWCCDWRCSRWCNCW